MNASTQLPDLSNVCLFLECQGFHISDTEQHTKDKEFILRELGYSHWFLTGPQSGSLLYSNAVSYEDLTADDKLDVKHRERYVHGLPFEDKFFKDNGISLYNRNEVNEDIVTLYTHYCTDARRSIAFKGYQTAQLLKNVSDTIPLINLDMFNFPEDMFDFECDSLPPAGRCERHYWKLYCCKQSCVNYAYWALSNKWTLDRDISDDITNRVAHLNI